MDLGAIDPHAVHMLAQYRPFEDGSAGIQAAHDDLVFTACHSNGGRFPNLEACRQFIETRLRVELELAEVRDARDRLVRDDQPVKVDGGLELTAEARAMLAAPTAGCE